MLALIVPLVMAAGFVGVVVGWRLVEGRGMSIWPVMVTVLGAAALASVLTGKVSWIGRYAGWKTGAVGLVAGVVLYLATLAFVLVVRHWPLFEKHVEAIYDQRGGLSVGVALLLAALVVAPCEEIFWRGLFQGRLGHSFGASAGWLGTLVAYSVANAASLSLPITFGAVVSGAVWGGLAWWSHGVLASICCHSVWTGLMIAIPPGGGSK